MATCCYLTVVLCNFCEGRWFRVEMRWYLGELSWKLSMVHNMSGLFIHEFVHFIDRI